MPTKFPKTVTVKVCKKDIQQGIPNSGSGCPIALALKRRFKITRDVYVSDYLVSVMRSSKHACYKLNVAGKRFVNRFDHRVVVRPQLITMTLEAN